MPLLVEVAVEAGDEDPEPQEAQPHVGGGALLVLALVPLVSLLSLDKNRLQVSFSLCYLLKGLSHQIVNAWK
jgi:hypothetical protein